MQETYVEPIAKVIRNKQKLEKALDVKITNKGKLVFVDGDAEKESTALEVLEAINLGFSTDRALLLTENGMMLQTVNIKDITKRQDLERVRGRIIGKQGKALSTIKKLTNCPISLQDNQIGIIGNAEKIEEAIQAVKSIILGSKHGNVYSRTEKEMKKRRIRDKEGI